MTARLQLTAAEQQQGYVSKILGTASLNELKVVPGSTAYRYDVEIFYVNSKGEQKDLTKQSDMLSRAALKETCQVIIEKLYGLTANFGSEGIRYVYDGRRTLYTNQEIKLNLADTSVQKEALPDFHRAFVKADTVNVSIFPNERAHIVDYSDWQSAFPRHAEDVVDHSARQFLEILTSQYFLNLTDGDRRLFQMVSSGAVFEKDAKGELVPGANYCTGMKKGVKIVAPSGNCPARAFAVIDAKRSAFYADKLVSEIYAEFCERFRQDAWKKMVYAMKGVRCAVVYRPSTTIVFESLTSEPLNNFKADGKVSISAYLKEKYKFVTDGKKLGVLAQRPRSAGPAVYPMDALRVVFGQIITMESMERFNDLSKGLLKENSVLPVNRYTIATSFMSKLGREGAEFLRAWGVNIVGKNSISIKTRPPVTVRMAGDPRVQMIEKIPGSFMQRQLHGKVLDPTAAFKGSNWIILRSSSVTPDNFASFVTQLKEHATEAGIELCEPMKMVINSREWKKELANVFSQAAKQNVKFIFYLDEGYVKSQGRLKLMESHYKIVTQHVVKLGQLGPQMMKNVVWKMNAKAGGINYLPNFEGVEEFDISKTNDVLIIGYDVAHPDANKDIQSLKNTFVLRDKLNEGKGDEERVGSIHPSVVGIAANKLRKKGAFGGDFFYQESRRESVNPELFRKAIADLVEQFCSYGGRPRRVIAIRDGVSEGQYAMVARDEYPALLAGIRDGVSKLSAADVNTPIEVLHLIVTKNHNKRIYRAAGKDLHNTMIGDVVNTDIVQPAMNEFYLQTHHGLKGVPKMSQYCCPINNMKISQGKIETLMLNLAYMHQICASPTSLPTPVYVAHETAKRGSDIYNEFRQLYTTKENDPLKHLTVNVRAILQTPKEVVLDYDALTKFLGYSEKSLKNVRYNA